VGNAGVNIVEQLISTGLDGIGFVAVNTDGHSLAASSAAEKVHLETKVLRGLGTAGDPERGRAMAEEQLPRLKALCEGARVVFIIGGLGGGAGTGIAPVLARAAKEAGALTMAFVVLPFDCEGSLRAGTARGGLERLREAADMVFCLPNQKALALIAEGASLPDTFKCANHLLGSTVRASCLALASQSLIGVSFADLCASTRQGSSHCSFAAAEATGANRVTEVVERLLAHPMLNGPASLAQAQSLAVCVLGGASLKMIEVNGVMDQIHAQCQGVPLMMGAATHPQAGEALVIALLIAHPEEAEEVSTHAAAAPEKAARPLPASRTSTSDLGVQLLDQSGMTDRPHSRFVPPPPEMSLEKMEQLRARHAATSGRKRSPRLRQTQLPLEIVSKGRFDQTAPTIHKGEDLDVPTYIRRGISLN
jgi:cell division protein FtsZ